MGYIPRDRDEEDALSLHRVRRAADAFSAVLVRELGANCRLFPAVKPSFDAVVDALSDLDGDTGGVLADLDPAGLLARQPVADEPLTAFKIAAE